jgi:hypothetical protein
MRVREDQVDARGQICASSNAFVATRKPSSNLLLLFATVGGLAESTMFMVAALYVIQEFSRF